MKIKCCKKMRDNFGCFFHLNTKAKKVYIIDDDGVLLSYIDYCPFCGKKIDWE